MLCLLLSGCNFISDYSNEKQIITPSNQLEVPEEIEKIDEDSIIAKEIWGNINPVKMINNKPLYINFIEDVPTYKSWNANVIEAGNKDDVSVLLIYSVSTLIDFELFRVYPNMYENLEYYKDEVQLSLDELTPGTVIKLNTVLPDVVDLNGISFTDSTGNRHIYTFGDNGKDTSFHLLEEPKIIIDNEKRDTFKNRTDEENNSSGTITIDEKVISSLFDCSLVEVVNVMGTPTGSSHNGTVNGTPSRIDYDGIHFLFDDDIVVREEIYNFTKLEYDGVSLNKNPNELFNILGEPTEEKWGEGLFGVENAYMITYDLAGCSIVFEFDGDMNVPPVMINISKHNQTKE